MSLPATLTLTALKNAIDGAEMGLHPVEVQATIMGLICGGIVLDGKSWRKPFNELVNDGQKTTDELYQLAKAQYLECAGAMIQENYNWMPLLNQDEATSLSEKLTELTYWVQAFLAGFALSGANLGSASKDAQEMLQDLSSIANVQTDVEVDNDAELAFEELTEYVKVVAFHLYSEFSDLHDTSNEDKPTLH